MNGLNILIVGAKIDTSRIRTHKEFEYIFIERPSVRECEDWVEDSLRFKPVYRHFPNGVFIKINKDEVFDTKDRINLKDFPVYLATGVLTFKVPGVIDDYSLEKFSNIPFPDVDTMPDRYIETIELLGSSVSDLKMGTYTDYIIKEEDVDLAPNIYGIKSTFIKSAGRR